MIYLKNKLQEFDISEVAEIKNEDVFRIEIAIQYRLFHDSSAQKVNVVLDGQETVIVLDGNLDEDWGDKIGAINWD